MNLTLQDPALVRDHCYVGGRWVGADNGATLAVHNPADGGEIGRVPALGAAETRRAVEAAAAAWPAWRDLTAAARKERLLRWHGVIQAHADDLARIMTAECGKPLAEARAEVAYGAGFVDWFAAEAERACGDTVPSPWPGRRIVVLKQPVGPCAAITPWNFPLAMITRKCAPALAAGCTVVVKPAAETPLTALALAKLAERAGLPAGVFNVVTGPAQVVGGELVRHPLIRKLSFTGSTAVGRQLMAQVAPSLKRLSLELGGNAPFIVFEDADPEAAVRGALQAKFRNSGQTCVCANRIFVHEAVYDAFAAGFSAEVAKLRVGDGFDPRTRVGPLISAAAVAKVERLVADAVAKGAEILVGGGRHPLGGNFYAPTVLAGVTPEMALFREEIFGPVAPLIPFRDEAEAIELANATDYGLAGYFYSRDLGRVWRVAEALECGLVGVNAGVISTPVAPFGGMKQSGFGREGSKYGLEEYLEIKYVCLGLE
ncbi:succinate-semialdehyde dehydrogenase/glutarate-semialdehyde dehydrogenase [Methylomarinovum tepidoasis]|uniref:Succinate-semialdehyde dehydrogenase/glutarate-semialdehyde dehydrogenase n=1 Tax=Methylomarinovum tepidoasis TaxID=2840183 RepID=A0AAU9BX17_9GAMM|nr:NAD-dependent succinate-semialdehyde dehydrogenase [Methylomarinovum sp. IN45]BCX87988.1 succinate-semialdehyde dehydrogenase/glutarate-semialdehyde dehydrogenase [Methylomarinovum sp. IN45]